ncbi:hypothetical protein BO82DRAFT_387963 [Aspergillus uvarum CBS 121591]|uniref:Uncharacterized protein n=1 Tax=Aspergillus uvarum CBS 121591 TaxID=1448315 RepID=A0A319BSK5_9EURO|nr:hypothetical protein BO82DRAFT_387963 [Aspergillus uvarum CBS 121591]PYH75514.1 hypothetical protein BO82DRAFT_387963 [Aspergillus uvarum CBS 121591]
MKGTATRELFYREQTIANLSAVFRKDVGVLTCQRDSEVVALAYTVEADGERVEVMQFHHFSALRVGEYFVNHNHRISKNELATCSINLPRTPELSIKPNQTTNLKDEVLPNDEVVYKEIEARLDGHVTETDSLSPKRLEQRDLGNRGFPSVIQIKLPFLNEPIREARHIAVTSRQAILQVVADLMSEKCSSKTMYPMKSLRVGDGNISHGILTYDHDDVGHFIDCILKSEDFVTIECVFEMAVLSV